MSIEITIITILLVLGIALLLAEIFLLPGLTIAGVAGGLSMGGAVIYAFYCLGSSAGYITLGIAVFLLVGMTIWLVKSNSLKRIELKTEIDSKVDQTEMLQLTEGQEGTTISRLNPIGKAEFEGGIVVEVKSLTGEYIDEGKAIKILKIDNNNVIVQAL